MSRSSAADQLLFRAVHQGDVLQCQSLILEMGASPNAVNAGGETLLHIAIAVGGRYTVMELLLGMGADPNIPTSSYLGSTTPLHQAVKKRLYQEVALLLDKGGDANLSDNKGRIPLHYAAEMGDMEMCRLLILAGNSVYNVTDKMGQTPQQIAKHFNFVGLAKWLANPRELEGEDLSPLKDNESKLVVINKTTLGLNARIK